MITVANIYAPNKDDPDFFNSIFHLLNNFENENLIIGGDFNVPLELSLDKKGGQIIDNHSKARNVLKYWTEEFDLHDIWRENHPQDKIFTWRRHKPSPVFCRLDYFLVSFNLIGDVDETNISPARF